MYHQLSENCHGSLKTPLTTYNCAINVSMCIIALISTRPWKTFYCHLFDEQFDVDEEEIDMLKVSRPISFSLCYLPVLVGSVEEGHS